MAAVKHDPDYLNLVDGDDDEDALSFSGFPIHESEPNCSSSLHEVFEFRTDSKRQTISSPGGIVFCGKIMDAVTPDSTSQSLGRGFVSGSELFVRNRSFRFGRESKSFSSPAVGAFGYQRNNSRRPKVLIGLTRTPSRMDLSEIRKRQARLAPLPMFHVVPAEEPVAVTVAADGTGGGISPWSLIRPLRYRSVLVRVLAKAASSCITHV